MDMGKYRETGVMKEEAYVDTSSEAIQKAVRKYEGQEPGELEQKVLQQEQSIRSINNEQYQEFHNNPEFIEITINHETLVQESQLASSWDMERRGMFASRIPGTWGDGEQTLVLPTEQVFRTDDGKTYIGFVERKEKQLILNADGSMVPSEKRSTGERLYAERYEPVSRKFGKKESLQKNTAEKEMIQTVIKQAPSKERNLRYGRETKITMGTFTQFICIADGYCVLSEWSGKTGRGNIGKLAESICLHLVASIAELVE